MKKIYYVTNIFPYYRKAIWEMLLYEKSYEFHFFFSNKDLNGIKSIRNLENKKLHHIKNIFFLKRVFWQSGIMKEIINNRPDKIILLGEMNILSNWLITLISKLLRIETIFWGHGLYGNEKGIKKFLRILFLKLADKHLLYGDRAKEMMLKLGFDSDSLFVIYNSLNFNKQNKLYKKLNMVKQIESPPLLKIIFIGRLTKNKRLDILLEAIKKTELMIKLIIIGDGEEKESLIELVRKYSVQNIHFLGEIFDEEIISEIIYNSHLCVSPGNIGLAAIHCLTYGTPVLTHNDFNFQMPEVEAIIDKKGGLFFKKDDVNDLVSKLNSFKKSNFKKSKVRETVQAKYNPEYQKSIFDKIISE